MRRKDFRISAKTVKSKNDEKEQPKVEKVKKRSKSMMTRTNQ